MASRERRSAGVAQDSEAALLTSLVPSHILYVRLGAIISIPLALAPARRSLPSIFIFVPVGALLLLLFRLQSSETRAEVSECERKSLIVHRAPCRL